MDSIAMLEKPHAVCIPFPAQGHINPMLKLAKLLHWRGFHITFVNTEYNHRRLLKSRGADSLQGLTSFRFETIPDGLPESDADVTQEISSLCDSTRKHCLASFRALLSKLNHTAAESNVPPITCIVSDAIMTFTVTAAQELGVPDVLFWTASACAYLAFLHYPNLMEKGLIPLKDESYITNGYLDTVIDCVPSMKDIRLKDFPSFLRTTDPNDLMLDFVLSHPEGARRGSAIIVNTFEDLEHEVLDALSTMLPPIYPIGPLQGLMNQVEDDNLKLMGSNLWKEEPQCIEWLDSKEPNSVVYVNFGSIAVMTPNQLAEFAWGLANSNQAFLWIIRPDLVTGDSAALPPEFVAETKDRGLLASWCPQEEVLAHPSVRGFLTHCGWNSTLESIASGVPMICWPFFADQQTNCWFCCTRWGVGMDIEGDVKRDEVEKLVGELMVGDKGKEMKERALQWKKMAEESTAGSKGSSFMNLEKMINQVLLSPRH